MTAAALVVAAGRGERFGAAENKLLLPLAGRPVLVWTLLRLRACPRLTEFVIVAAERDREAVAALSERALRDRPWQLATGGTTRSESVRSGLAALPANVDWVAIHDGARPLVAPALVERLLDAAQTVGAAIPALPVTDTIVRGRDDRLAAVVPREGLFTVQTPQVFRRTLIEAAYASADGPATDDATLVHRLGEPVRLVPGDPDNLKITVPADLERAERLLAAGESRSGFGYDVHAFAEGRPLFLGGVQIPHPRGLAGHSDADVLLHAIADALLGAAALGDIGLHYPDNDPRFAGIASLTLLADVRQKLADAGWVPVHVDAMLVAEAPKIRAYVETMRARIAEALLVTPDRVSIKATTNEGMGFIGRREGIAAYATATIRRAIP